MFPGVFKRCTLGNFFFTTFHVYNRQQKPRHTAQCLRGAVLCYSKTLAEIVHSAVGTFELFTAWLSIATSNPRSMQPSIIGE